MTSILLSNIPRTNINYQNQTAVSYFRYIFSPALHLFKPVLISKPPYVRWPNPHYNLKPSLLLSKMNILSTYIALAALLVSSDKHCLTQSWKQLSYTIRETDVLHNQGNSCLTQSGKQFSYTIRVNRWLTVAFNGQSISFTPFTH